jgi:hypothetical protein
LKLALLTLRLFEKPRSGGEICTFRLMHALREAGHEVVSIGRGSSRAAAGTISLGSAVVPFDDLPIPRKALAVAAAIAQGQASTVQRVNTDGASQRASRALAAMTAEPDRRADALVVDHLQAYAWVAAASIDLPPVVLVMHNLESSGYAEQARRLSGRGAAAVLRRGMLNREARHLHALERLALRRAAAIACLSDGDADYFRERVAAFGSKATVVVLPGYPLAPPMTATRCTPFRMARRIGMIGTWTWGPNRDALYWMLERVIPLWPEDCTLVLAGSGLEDLVLPARVVSLGRLDEVSSFYATVDVIAVPSLHGSGVQEKAIEAIGSGRTLVATMHALRGLDPGLPSNVYIADDPLHFARLCAEAPTAPNAGEREQLLQWSARRRAHYAAAVDSCVAAATVTTNPKLMALPSSGAEAKTA